MADVDRRHAGDDVLTAEAMPLRHVAAKAWDVLVVGAGPAGVAAAMSAARCGADVLLVDRASFPRAKVCGGCLNPKALRRMETLGVADVLDEIGAPQISGLEVRAPGGGGHGAILRTGAGRAVSRSALDGAMLERARRTDGVSAFTQTNATVEPLSRDADGHQGGDGAVGRIVTLRHADGAHARAQAGVVIVADGLKGSSLRNLPAFNLAVKSSSRMGVGCVMPNGPGWIEPGRVLMACHAAGYVGMVRVEGEAIDVAGAIDPVFVKACGGPGPAADRIVRASGWPGFADGAAESASGDGRWMGTGLLTRRRKTLMAPGVMTIGDAAGYVEPFTGEGMAWALESGMATGAVAAGLAREWSEAAAQRWARAERKRMMQRQRACRLVAWMLRRPLVVRGFVSAASRAPSVARPFVRAVQGGGGAARDLADRLGRNESNRPGVGGGAGSVEASS